MLTANTRSCLMLLARYLGRNALSNHDCTRKGKPVARQGRKAIESPMEMVRPPKGIEEEMGSAPPNLPPSLARLVFSRRNQ